MTQPADYEPRPMPNVTALYHPGDIDSAQAIVDWATPLLLGSGSAYIGYGTRVYIQNGDNSIGVTQQQYVFLDGTTFRVLDKNIFELLYQVDDGI